MAKYKFTDIAINSTAKKKPIDEDKYTYLGLEHLDSENLQITRYGSQVAPIGEKLIMKKGDVLFGKRRAYQKKVAIAPFDGIFSAHGMVLRPREDVVDKNFFPFFISSDYFLDKAISISVGGLSPTINWKDLKDTEFNLPDMEEQKRLAKILWAAEDLKQKTYSALKLSEIHKDVYIKDLLEAKILLDELDLKSKNEISNTFSIARTAKELHNVEISEYEMIKNLPPDWDQKRLASLISISSGKMIKFQNYSEKYKFPVYGGNGVIGYWNNSNVNAGTIVIGRVGSCGSLHVTNDQSWVTDNAFIVDYDKDILISEFLLHWLKLLKLNEKSNSSVQPVISGKDIYPLIISIPKINVQNSIVNHLSTIQTNFDILNESVSRISNLQKRIVKEL